MFLGKKNHHNYKFKLARTFAIQEIQGSKFARMNQCQAQRELKATPCVDFQISIKSDLAANILQII